MQLPPARARQARQGRHQGRGRDPDGVQHRRDLRRDHDGHVGDEDEPGVAGGRRGLDRARDARALLRRRDRAVRLRQDDPGNRDGAGAPRRARRDALRRVDPARPLQGPRHHDHGRLRGGRRERGGQDHRPGAGGHRGRREPRGGRLRRAVHGQHDGDGVRDDGHQPDRAVARPRAGRDEVAGRLRGRRADHGRAQARPEAERSDHTGVARERDPRGGGLRRLHQRRPAPARGGQGSRCPARHRRLRPDRRIDPEPLRPQAGRALRRHRPARRGRHRGARRAGSSNSACCTPTRRPSRARASASTPTRPPKRPARR